MASDPWRTKSIKVSSNNNTLRGHTAARITAFISMLRNISSCHEFELYVFFVYYTYLHICKITKRP